MNRDLTRRSTSSTWQKLNKNEKEKRNIPICHLFWFIKYSTKTDMRNDALHLISVVLGKRLYLLFPLFSSSLRLIVFPASPFRRLAHEKHRDFRYPAKTLESSAFSWFVFYHREYEGRKMFYIKVGNPWQSVALTRNLRMFQSRNSERASSTQLNLPFRFDSLFLALKYFPRPFSFISVYGC